MRLIDLSQPLFDNAPNCPVHPPVSFRRTADHPQDGWRMEEIAMAHRDLESGQTVGKLVVKV